MADEWLALRALDHQDQRTFCVSVAAPADPIQSPPSGSSIKYASATDTSLILQGQESLHNPPLGAPGWPRAQTLRDSVECLLCGPRSYEGGRANLIYLNLLDTLPELLQCRLPKSMYIGATLVASIINAMVMGTILDHLVYGG